MRLTRSRGTPAHGWMRPLHGLEALVLVLVPVVLVVLGGLVAATLVLVLCQRVETWRGNCNPPHQSRRVQLRPAHRSSTTPAYLAFAVSTCHRSTIPPSHHPTPSASSSSSPVS